MFDASPQIERFFAPLVPCDVEMCLNDDGRPSGQARVSFETTEDARQAMKKNKDYIGERYVELHLDGRCHARTVALAGIP